MERAIRALLPPGAEVEVENFAGDPLVQRFVSGVRDGLGLDTTVFVHWAGPPDTLVHRSKRTGRVVLARSERFDSLLFEFLKVFSFCLDHSVPTNPRLVMEPAVRRWSMEFLLGYRAPSLALAAINDSSMGLKVLELGVQSFRDANLEATPEPLRTAMQCFCLAHEFGHVRQPPSASTDYDELVDGVSLRQHLRRAFEEAQISSEESARQEEFVVRSLPARKVVREIEADLFAFSAVAEFVAFTFDVRPERLIKSVLLACTAQSQVLVYKHSCKVLAQVARSPEVSTEHVSLDESLYSVLTSLRARCVLRRAAFVWFALESPGAPFDPKAVDALRKRVDAMFVEMQPSLAALSEVSSKVSESILESVTLHRESDGSAVFENRLAAVKSDSYLWSQLYGTLIAFGLPGGTNVESYLRWAYEAYRA